MNVTMNAMRSALQRMLDLHRVEVANAYQRHSSFIKTPPNLNCNCGACVEAREAMALDDLAEHDANGQG